MKLIVDAQLPRQLALQLREVGFDALHTLDLQRATGQPMALPPATSSMVVALMAQLAEPITLLSALTGRGALPDDLNVLR